MALSGIFIRDSLSVGLAHAEVTFPAYLEHEVLETAIEALEYAKENAPWEDRTGDARAGLDTDVSIEGHRIIWELYHTVEYGLYLETKYNARDAIIMPTLEMFAPKVADRMNFRGFNG